MKKIIALAVLLLLVLAYCQSQKSERDTGNYWDEYSDIINDSFIVRYNQPVNGYNVEAIVKLGFDDLWDILSADLTFIKDGKSFTLHTRCFGDSAYSKGKAVYNNSDVLRRYKNKTFNADYHDYRKQDEPMRIYAPFFFKDMDFDGIEELVIVHHTLGVNHHDGYDVYRIVEGEPVLIDYPPYNNNKDYWGFGMTDYPHFDYKNKTISCPHPEGELSYTGRTIYGISKKQKDTVIVNGKKHYFNHLELIKEESY